MAHIPSPIPPDNAAAVRKITEISGENIYLCMQCGTCSAVCPMIDSMGFTTRQGMHLLQFGQTDEVVDAKIGEYCAACHTCMVRCPRGIAVPRVFEAVRLLTLRQNIDLIKPEDLDKEMLEKAPQITFVSGFRKLTA
jgi:heterodisulfide reductase subunit C